MAEVKDEKVLSPIEAKMEALEKEDMALAQVTNQLQQRLQEVAARRQQILGAHMALKELLPPPAAAPKPELKAVK